MDLAFWEQRPLLTVVNINSRIGYADLIPNKQADTVLKAIKAFVKMHHPRVITSDNGSEFMNQHIQTYFKKVKITHFNNEPGEHSTMGKIERFNRTIKQRLLRSGARLTKRLVADLIDNYNSTIHSAIGMTPNEAKGTIIQSELDHNRELMTKVDYEFEVGQTVVYRLKQKQFGKESASGFVKLGITNAGEDGIFEAEEILNHKKLPKGKYQYLVKWRGYDQPSWEPQDNLRLINKNEMSTLEKQYFS
ncbi:unnamed protein product [Phytophthora lilii]|uniref:Unnamed protein product n=1 Tax=Phytophthora lilii TaxID=2077276 RepID=A0A9W7CRD8_9STRA|nr:unnamed protein product [Phytophthora lilii]